MSDKKSINIYAVGAVLAFVVFGVLAHGGIFNSTEAEETPATEEIAAVETKAEEIVDGKIEDEDLKSRLTQMVDKTLELAKRN